MWGKAYRPRGRKQSKRINKHEKELMGHWRTETGQKQDTQNMETEAES